MSVPATRRNREDSGFVTAALFTGAGLSHTPPASLPLAQTFHQRLYDVLGAAAGTFAPGLVDHGALDGLKRGPWNVLSRLENTWPGSGAGALACMQVTIPNEAQLLAALHLAHGGLHVTVNVDEGIELAYALLSGAAALPNESPAAYREALPAWRRCFPGDAPTLRIVADPVDFASASYNVRPLLVKLHGSIGRCRDGVVLPLPLVSDDVDVIELGRQRRAALDALADEAFVVVTGYSGGDFASYVPLVARLKRGRFSWVAPMIRPEVHSALRAIDPKQPVTGRAVDTIRADLPVTPPAWPREPTAGPGFEERFAAWAAALPTQAAAETIAWVLADAGDGREAVALLERLCNGSNDVRTSVRLADALAQRREPGDEASSARLFLSAAGHRRDRTVRMYAFTRWGECRGTASDLDHGNRASIATAHVVVAAAVAASGRRGRATATSAAVKVLLSQVERVLGTAIRSRLRRLLLRTLAEAAAAKVARVLAQTEQLPSGRRRMLLRRQAVELAAIAALLGGEPPSSESLHLLRRLCRMYDHLADPRGLADVLGTRALVWLARGNLPRALHSFQHASRIDPPLVGVRATVQALLDLSGEASRVLDSPRDQNNGSGHRARPHTIGGTGSRRSRPTDDGDRSKALDAFVRALPKVELHVHLEGSIGPATLAALARLHRDRRVPWTTEEVRRWYRFRSYIDFFNAYVLTCDQLRTAEDFTRVTTELGEMLARQNVRYAEVTFSPVAHIRRGISPGDLFAGLDCGRRQSEAAHGVCIRWCAAFGTRRGPAAAIETIELVLTQRPAGVVSLGLAGLESATSRADFAPAFALAREAGLRCVAHAGEAAGPESVWEALDLLGAERIGHGIRSVEDPALIARLRQTATPLEICPTSNVRTGVVSSFCAHPFRRLVAEGLVVTLNTDNPAMFDTDLNAEYLNAAQAFELGRSALTDLARAGVRAAFLPRADAEALLREIDSVAVPNEL